MMGRPQPDEVYVQWWERRDPFEMERQARRLSVGEAGRLIRAAREGRWHDVRKLWMHYSGDRRG